MATAQANCSCFIFASCFTLLVTVLVFFAFCPKSTVAKDLKMDLHQIEAVVNEWEQELEGFVQVPAAEIPDLNGKSLHIVEMDPGNKDSQRYLVYRKMSVDPNMYTRHVAYLRRFKSVSAVEWTPFYKSEDAVAEGNFIEQLVPSLYTHKRCNAIVSTPARLMHNYFYKQEWGCTLPAKYQACCSKEGAQREELDLEELGRAVEEVEEDEEEEGQLTDEHLVGGLGNQTAETVSAMRPRRAIRTSRRNRRAIKYTKKISADELEILADQLKNIEGPPGYFALGEFYQDVLDLMNGSQIVYETRERVDAIIKEDAASGSQSEIVTAENELMTTVADAKLPSLEDPNSAYTGYLSCNYSAFTTTRPAMDKLKPNVVRFYLHKLRAQCVPFVYDKTVDLFENDLVSVTTGLRTALNTENDLLTKAAVTKTEWNDLISAVMFVTVTNAYMDVAERMTRGVQDNRNPMGENISWTVRTTTVIAIRTVALIDEMLSAHVVKTLQIVATMVKEQFFVSLNNFLKLEAFCQANGATCDVELQRFKNDHMQLISLIQFVVFGTSNALQKKQRWVADEFNRFYIKTIEHTQGIYDKVLQMRKLQQNEQGKAETAKEDKAPAPGSHPDDEVFDK